MIPSGKAHNEMLLNDYLGETGAADLGSVICEEAGSSSERRRGKPAALNRPRGSTGRRGGGFFRLRRSGYR